MAFTISHAVLAPILNRLSAGHLPIAALAIGCMAPDLYRLFTQQNYIQAHQWSGIFSFSLWIGLAFCFVWYLLYRPVIYAVFGLNHKLQLQSYLSVLKFSCSCIIAVLLGIATHLIWDGLTHVDFRTFAFHEFLSQSIALFGQTYPVHRVLQIGTSAVALPIIVWMCWHYYRHFYQTALVRPRKIHFAIVTLFFSLLLGVLSVLDYVRYFDPQLWQTHTYYLVGRSINEFSQGFLSSMTMFCILFLFIDQRGYLD